MTFEGQCEFKREDGGMALIAEFGGDGEAGMFVRLHSWDKTRNHSEAIRLAGKHVRITVEVVG